MTPKTLKYLAWAAAAVGIIFVVLVGDKACYHKIETKAETQSHIDQGKAEAHADQAKTSDKAVADLQGQLDAAKADMGRLTLERGALLRKLAAEKQNRPDQGLPVGSTASAAVAPVSVDLSTGVIAKDAEVIEAQLKVIQGQTSQIAALVISRDQWKAAYGAETRRATGLEIALAAQKKISGADRWLGRIEGLAVGIGVGYVGGRLK